MYGIETLSTDRVLNEEHFYGKIMQKMCTKSQSKTPFYFGKQTETDFLHFACKKFF